VEWRGGRCRVRPHMTCSTFILIYSAGGERHHGIASSSLLYYNTFVFILLPRTGLNALQISQGAAGPLLLQPSETMG